MKIFSLNGSTGSWLVTAEDAAAARALLPPDAAPDEVIELVDGFEGEAKVIASGSGPLVQTKN
ncbi:MAG: hypothetical protein RIE22_05285 [Alphaproteobacteria bacterium]